MAGYAAFLNRPILRENQLDFLVAKKGIDTYPYLLRSDYDLLWAEFPALNSLHPSKNHP